MSNWFGVVVLLLLSSSVYAQTMKVSEDIEVKKLSDKVYGYTAWANIGKWGRVGSNGVIVVDKKKAFLFDTPMHEAQTIELLGNTADAAPLTEWLRTVTGVQQKFPDAKIIIPGHGKIGGSEIL